MQNPKKPLNFSIHDAASDAFENSTSADFLPDKSLQGQEKLGRKKGRKERKI